MPKCSELELDNPTQFCESCDIVEQSDEVTTRRDCDYPEQQSNSCWIDIMCITSRQTGGSYNQAQNTL